MCDLSSPNKFLFSVNNNKESTSKIKMKSKRFSCFCLSCFDIHSNFNLKLINFLSTGIIWNKLRKFQLAFFCSNVYNNYIYYSQREIKLLNKNSHKMDCYVHSLRGYFFSILFSYQHLTAYREVCWFPSSRQYILFNDKLLY